VGGVYVFRTTSWASIPNLVEGLTALQRATGGVLQWIRFRFEIVQEKRRPAGGDAPPVSHWVATISYPGRQEQLLGELREMLALRAPLMTEIQRQGAIVSGWDDDDEAAAAAREAEFPGGAATSAAGDGVSEEDRSAAPPDDSAGEESREAPEQPAGQAAQGSGGSTCSAGGPRGDAEGGDGERATDGMVSQVYNQAKRRAEQLELAEDGWQTLLADVMRQIGLEDHLPEGMPREKVNAALDAIRGYELPG